MTRVLTFRTVRSRVLATLGVMAIAAAGFFASGLPVFAAAGSVVSGMLWNDAAMNQTMPSSGAVTPSGVTVQLVNPATGVVVASTTTNASGQYSFSNVANGLYKVLITAPSYMKFPTSLSGNTNDFVSTGQPATTTDPYQGTSAQFTITGATQETNLDAGLQPVATLNVHPVT